MAHTEIIVRVIHDKIIFEEHDYVRIQLKPFDPKQPKLYSSYIGTIQSIQNDCIVLNCDGDCFNIYTYEIDKMRFAHEKETFYNTPNFEDEYKEGN